MARTATKSSASTAASVNTTEAAELMKEDVNAREAKETKLLDNEEVAIESLIPNVSYYDSKTGDMYEWDNAGDIVYMTVGTLKDLWRTSKGYFRNMWLRPSDDRVIKQFGMQKIFEKYEYLMEPSNYTRDNVCDIIKEINAAPNSLKSSLVKKIINMVSDGKITDIKVIRDIEKYFDLDLISLL